jgi:hypothetical protein
MKNLFLTGASIILLLTSCNKDEKIQTASLEQQKLDYQARQIDIEKQKLAIEKEKINFEKQKDSLNKVEAEKAKKQVQVKERVVYRDSPRRSSGTYAGTSSSGSSGTAASTGTTATQKKGWSSAAKGTVIGTVGGAAAGAIISKESWSWSCNWRYCGWCNRLYYR